MSLSETSNSPPPSTARDRTRSIPAGMVLFHAGDPAGSMFLVRSGCVRVLDSDPSGGAQPIELARIGKGGLVGELAPVLGRPRSATVEAVTETVLEALTPDEARILVSRSDRFATTLARLVVERSRLAPAEARARAHANAFELPIVDEAVAPPAREFPEPLHDRKRTFTKLTECPCCGASFHAVLIRASQDVPYETESDFHNLYRVTPTPYDYAIRVCPGCLYASLPSDFLTVDESLHGGMRAVAETVVSGTWGGVKPDFNRDRTLDLRRHSLELAIACYAARGAGPARFASLRHQLAWCSREAGNEPAELVVLTEARKDYRAALDLVSESDTKEFMRLTYLYSELSLRLGDAEEAISWFWQMCRNPKIKMYPAWEQRARARWEQARLVTGQTTA